MTTCVFPSLLEDFFTSCNKGNVINPRCRKDQSGLVVVLLASPAGLNLSMLVVADVHALAVSDFDLSSTEFDLGLRVAPCLEVEALCHDNQRCHGAEHLEEVDEDTIMCTTSMMRALSLSETPRLHQTKTSKC